MITLLAFLSLAFAGQPGGTAQVAPKAPSAPMATAPNPGAANPATTVTASNGPLLGRTGYVLETPQGCPGLTTTGGQYIRGDIALQLQGGAIQTLDACGRLATAQAGAIRETTLAQAGAGLINPVVTTMGLPDGTVIVTAPAAGAAHDYARVDAIRGTVVVANGPAATWAAASNGGQTYPVGLAWGGGGAWGAVASAQGAINAGIGQPTPVMITPTTTPAAPPRATVTRPTTPPPATPTTPNPEAAEAILRAAAR